MTFPIKALDRHAVVLGITGSGKSYFMRGQVEKLLEEQKRVCVIDPKGDWWGLKSSADGKHAGFPLVIFGGDHADMPLNAQVGGQVAELVGTGNRPCILDFGGWQVGERTRFWIDFAHGLFKANRQPLWLVIDEVHNFAPQAKIYDPDAGKCLHWTNRLASEGRGKGLRLLMASQRPQKVHKDTLTCAGTLVAMRVIHPRDRDAVKEWIDGCGDPKQGGEVLNSLAKMPTGEGWVWAPEIEFLKRLAFPKIKTFDSFAAPTMTVTGKPKGWAEVDLDEVRQKLAGAVEQAKANDPVLLRQEVARLKGELIRSNRETRTEVVKEIEKVLFSDKDRKLLDKAVRSFEDLQETIREREKDWRDVYRELNTLRGSIEVLLVRQKSGSRTDGSGMSRTGVSPVSGTVSPVALRPLPTEVLARQSRIGVSPGTEGMPQGERKVLTAIAQYQERGGVTREQLSVLAGYKRSTRDLYLQLLGRKGYVAENAGGLLVPTVAGMNALGPGFEPLPTGEALREYWLARLPQGEKQLLQVLVLAYPQPQTRERLSEQTGYKRSTRDLYLQQLARRRLVEFPEPGAVVASKELFE